MTWLCISVAVAFVAIIVQRFVAVMFYPSYLDRRMEVYEWLDKQRKQFGDFELDTNAVQRSMFTEFPELEDLQVLTLDGKLQTVMKDYFVLSGFDSSFHIAPVSRRLIKGKYQDGGTIAWVEFSYPRKNGKVERWTSRAIYADGSLLPDNKCSVFLRDAKPVQSWSIGQEMINRAKQAFGFAWAKVEDEEKNTIDQLDDELVFESDAT